MKQIAEILNKFNPISLNDLDGVKLLNRIDTKYLAHKSLLNNILPLVTLDYFILEIDACRRFRYESKYFDTSDDTMYLHHHNDKTNRYKIRLRNYTNTGLTFIEIKKKTKGNKTVKSRKKVADFDADLCTESFAFINDNSPFKGDCLTPKISTSFCRITLVNRQHNERVTIDQDLTFMNDKHSNVNLNNLVIVEVKSDLQGYQSAIKNTLKAFRINPAGMSKYCIGRALLDKKLKQNSFKQKILTINKIEHDKLLYRNPVTCI